MGAGPATANYVGYLLGSVAAIVPPALVTSRPALRCALLVMVLSMAAMPATTSVAAWSLPMPEGHDGAAPAEPASSPRRRWFRFLLLSYTLEGVGYIIAGTFLVAAVDRGGPGWLGATVWIFVGLAAASPSLS